MVVFPVIQLEGKDTFTIAQNRLAIKVNVGQFLDEKLDEGIMVYNMDLMGSKLHLRYKRVAFNYTIYGDLTNAIGLRVDDLHAFSFRHYAHGDSGYAGVSLVTAAPPYSAKKHHSYLNVFAGKTSSGGLSLYGQLSYLLFSPDGLSVSRSLTRQLAAVAGVTIRHSSPKFSLTNSTELRYYGMTYNLFHSDVQLRYRKPATDAYTMYANTVGKYLYPLRKFDTPFSQWAVFTEYIGNNLFAAAVTGTIDYAPGWIMRSVHLPGEALRSLFTRFLNAPPAILFLILLLFPCSFPTRQ